MTKVVRYSGREGEQGGGVSARTKGREKEEEGREQRTKTTEEIIK